MANRMGTKLPPRFQKQKRTGKRPIPRSVPGGPLGAAPMGKLSSAEIRRLTVDDKSVNNAPYVPDSLKGKFKNIEFGMKDMPAGYKNGGCVMKGRGGKFKGVK